VAIGIEPFDGDHRAVSRTSGQPDDALVDASEAALADLEQPAEVAGGGLELPKAELAEAVGAPLLVQLRDAPRRRDRYRARRLIRRRPYGRARAHGLACADGRRRRRGEGQVGARARGDGGGERGRRGLLPPPLALVLLLKLDSEAAEATHFLEQSRRRLSSSWSLSSCSPSPQSNYDGNEQLVNIETPFQFQTTKSSNFEKLFLS
jgi:hypothetical protein